MLQRRVGIMGQAEGMAIVWGQAVHLQLAAGTAIFALLPGAPIGDNASMQTSSILSSALLLLVACGGETTPAPSTPEPVVVTPAPSVEPVASAPAVEPVASTPAAAPEGSPAGTSCGSRGQKPCAADLFCNFPASAHCGETDKPGSCEKRPEMCTRDYRPVCGCDGKTYGNACTAMGAGQSVAAQGECKAKK